MEQTKQKWKSRKKMVLYAFLLSAILLSTMVAIKLLPFTSLGADTTNLAIETELEKYINYSLSNKNYEKEENDNKDSEEKEEQDRGTLLQYKVTTKIEDGDKAFPVQESQLLVHLGQIEGQYPYEAKTITGEETQYDATTGTLEIYAKDQREATYAIVAYYDTYTENQEEREIGIKVQAQAILANEEHHQISREGDYHTVVTENIGDLTSIHCETQDIYNGYLKSNRINGTSYITSYEQIEQIVVSKKEAQATIETLEQNTLIQQDTDLGNHGCLVYQSTQILKSDKDRILGEEGTIEFLDGEGNVIATIDANTPFDESGILTISYEEEQQTIGIRTSPIMQEGILQIKHTKAMKETVTDVQDIKIKTTIYRKDRDPYEMLHEIKDTQTKVNVNISHTNWNNRQQNELTFDIYLDASTVQNNLFKNPSVQIELPSQVEKVVLDNNSIMYANGLTLQDPYVTTNEAGNLVMVANLAGAQTQYDENTLGLRTNIKIEAAVILKKEMQSAQETVKINYTNQYTLDGSVEIGNQYIPVQLESYQEERAEEAMPGETFQEEPQGEQSVQEMQLEEEPLVGTSYENEPLAENNPNLQLEVVPTKGNHSVIRENDIVYEGEYIKYNIKATNTSDQTMEQVKVVASIPEGVTYGELEAQLYQFRGKYSYNFDKQLREKVINIGNIGAGKTVEFFYEVKVNDLAEGETEKQIVTRIHSYVGEQLGQSYEISNQVQPSEVELFMSTLIDYGGWAYGVNVKSDTQEEVEVKIHLPQAYQLEQIIYIPQNVEEPWNYEPQGTEDKLYEEVVYTDYSYEEDNPGEQVNTLKLEIDENHVISTKLKTNCFYEFTGKIDTVNLEKPSELATKVELISYVEGIVNGATYPSNENRIEVGYPNIKVSMTSENEGEKVKYEDQIDYEITIENVGGFNVREEEFDETVVINVLDFLPEGVNPQSVTYDTWEIIYKDVKTDENETAEQVIDQFVKKSITKEIPKEMVDDEDGSKLPNVDLNIILPKGEKTTVRISTTAGFVYQETEVENSATIAGDEIDTKTTNMIKHIILPYYYEETENPSNPDDPNDPNDPNHPINPSLPNDSNNSDQTNGSGNNNQREDLETNCSISGVAWIDEDENGERSSEEPVLSDVTVMLVDRKDTSTVKSTTKTNNSGSYQFANLSKGNYLVIFKYDTNQYTLTQYQKAGIDRSVNSDASSKTITLYGEQIDVGITDAIDLNGSASNIDVGLLEKKACDFKIDKYITKVTVQTKSGNKQYTYDHAKLAKTEIKAKEIEGANIIVEYKIVITNEGEIAGTVNKIVDYLPDGFSFSSNLNKTWVKGESQQLINTSLANQKIPVGESVNVTLIATKKMTTNTTGTFTNKVSIENATSIAGIADEKTENNTSSADIILSVSTGAIVYIAMIIGILILLSVIGFYLYKKGKIKIRRIPKMTFMIMFCTIMIFSLSSNVLGISNYKNDQSFNWYAPHKFHGGPTGEGVCMDHSLQAYSTNGRPRYKFSYRDMTDKKTEKKQTTTGEFTLEKRNRNRDIEGKESGNDYIYGPFQYRCTKDATYSVSVYNKKGQSISGSVICDENGATKSLRGEGDITFFLKIDKNQCKDGIAKVELKAKAKITRTTIIGYCGKPVYKSKAVEKSQRIKVHQTMKYKIEEKKQNINVTETIEWAPRYHHRRKR